MEVRMSDAQLHQYDLDNMPPAMNLQSLVLMMVAVVVGTALAIAVLPIWLPGLAHSLLGPNPQIYWFLSRGSAIIAYILLWLSMVLGVMMTNKMARAWPGGPVAYDLHQHTSLLGLAYALFHASFWWETNISILTWPRCLCHLPPLIIHPYGWVWGK